MTQRKPKAAEAPLPVEAPRPEPEADGALPRLLTAEDILAAEDVRMRRLHVPEWGGDVLISSLTSARRAKLLPLITDENGDPVDFPIEQRQAVNLMLHLVDEQDRPLFSLEQLDALAARNVEVMDRIGKAIRELDPTAARIEDAAGN